MFVFYLLFCLAAAPKAESKEAPKKQVESPVPRVLIFAFILLAHFSFVSLSDLVGLDFACCCCSYQPEKSD